jgi:Signal transduction histidine kinase involved in nitrogen fixation and metabolism regulation
MMTTPILELTSTTTRITENHNYTVQMHYERHDKLNQLYTNFNKMLTQIQSQNDKLLLTQQNLEFVCVFQYLFLEVLRVGDVCWYDCKECFVLFDDGFFAGWLC